MDIVSSPMRDVECAVAQAKSVENAVAVELTEYEDIAFVLRSRDFAPIRAESGHGGQWHTLLVRDSIVDLHGDDHFERRRLLSGLFKKATLLTEYERDFLIPAFKRFLEEHRANHAGSVFDLVPVARKLMVRVIARLVGLDGIDDDQTYAEFESVLVRVEHGARSKFAQNPEAIVADALYAQETLVEDYFKPAWARRAELVSRVTAGDLPEEHLPTDLITLMVQHEQHYAKFGDDAAFREASLLLIASIGSTTNAVCFAVWDLHTWLLQHPEDAEKRLDPGFLRSCFAESLRLGQTNTLLRTADADCTLPSGVVIKAGEVALMNRPAGNLDLAAHGDSTLTENEFDPYRVLDRKAPQYGLAFGGGAHMCIGRDFAFGSSGRRGNTSADDDLGVGMRLFFMLQEAKVAVAPGVEPNYDPRLPGRPTWETLSVTVEAQ